jgi:hypothetical protein
MPTIFGYARVSTDAQTLDAQVSALKAAGAVRVFRETAGGAKTGEFQQTDVNAHSFCQEALRGLMAFNPRFLSQLCKLACVV